MLQGKRIGSNDEVMSETEAYVEAKDKLFNKKGIEFFRNVGVSVGITLEWDYVNE